ncbi:26 proteasome-like protein complex subunit Sem1 [Dendryphion nanum]|uniref:26S proteasome complex subunit SEM1 n=1 Tax=Dendryphion nanum TaxID=256645 RepID=A0A9P9E474_9PLEO|nr:26 proteasome-like protein complex subunit Sem1 [Dendryphion nanum]
MASASDSKKPADSKAPEQPKEQQKPAAQLEEDDEFEDFPIEDWTEDDTQVPAGGNTHLWEESWDDDDTSDDFSVQLREELKKLGQK